MKKRKKIIFDSSHPIIITNYYSTKLFLFSMLYALHLNKNKFLLSKKKSRINYFYSSLNFNIKYENWKSIETLLAFYILEFKKSYKYWNPMNFISSRPMKVQLKHIEHRLLEKLFYK